MGQPGTLLLKVSESDAVTTVSGDRTQKVIVLHALGWANLAYQHSLQIQCGQWHVLCWKECAVIRYGILEGVCCYQSRAHLS